MEFASAELVVTDRLHGMIFATITGTPCLVFSNNNHKVSESYKWIHSLPYIKFIKTAEEAISFIPELLNMQECKYDTELLQPQFKALKEFLAKVCE